MIYLSLILLVMCYWLVLSAVLSVLSRQAEKDLFRWLD
jgi:hypothetical protein